MSPCEEMRASWAAEFADHADRPSLMEEKTGFIRFRFAIMSLPLFLQNIPDD